MDNDNTHDLKYDKIIKHTLEQSPTMTIRFINGLFNDNIPLDAPVVWLDKETVDDEYKAIIADFYPRINGRMYSIEVEHDDNGDMAMRVFRYSLGGALYHNTIATDAELRIEFPQPCVIFLQSTKNTPRNLTWNINFYDGQSVTLKVPTVHLKEMSVKEITERGLLPIGQFYPRTFEPLKRHKVDAFRDAVNTLLDNLEDAVKARVIPYNAGMEMQEIVRMTTDNVVIKAKKAGDIDMTTNILETLPWVDYSEMFKKMDDEVRAEREAKGRAEGLAEGKAEGLAEGLAEGKAEGLAEGYADGIAATQKAFAEKMFERRDSYVGLSTFAESLTRNWGIPKEIVNEVYAQYNAEHERKARKRNEYER